MTWPASLRAVHFTLHASETSKGRFSECSDAVCDDEDGGGGEQGKDDPSEPILPSIQSFVREHPSAAVLDNASDFAEP